MAARYSLITLLILAACLRLPFLNQAFQLDDGYYLAGARYVQTDPAHPARTSYVFLGERVDMSGHPHPPLDVWFLGLVLFLIGQAREAPFHAAYGVFTLLATWAVYGLARRFSKRPGLATLLFLAAPAFVVHGNGLESDIPFVALLLAGIHCFVSAVDSGSHRRLSLAALFLGLASLAAYQAVFFVPILGGYLWLRRRWWWPAMLVAVLPLAVTGGYQLYQRASSGALPVTVLAGHLENLGLQSARLKLRNALALTAHLGWFLCPALAAAAFLKRRRGLWALAAVAALGGAFADPNPLFWASFALGAAMLAACAGGVRRAEPGPAFLRLWIVVFFAGALTIFFAGAARYLLPLAAPLAILAVNELEDHPGWLWTAVVVQMAFSLSLAWVHYQHSGAYREFVRAARSHTGGGRVWVNGEWGLQYYAQQAGAQPLLRDQLVKPGDWILSNRLGYPVPFAAPGGEMKLVSETAVTPRLPLRLIALQSRSAFSTVSFGVRPFDIGSAPVDVLRLETVVSRPPALSWLPMNAPDAGRQIVRGLYGVEENQWRWMGKRAALLLKTPAKPAAMEAEVFLPEQSPGRRISLWLDGRLLKEETLPGPGRFTLRAEAVVAGGESALLTLEIDRTFRAPGDRRDLGLILFAAGFR